MALNITGIDPDGETRFYAVRVQPSWVSAFIVRAKELGWTELGTTPYVPVPDAKDEELTSKEAASATGARARRRSR